jgi:hypothetical protein
MKKLKNKHTTAYLLICYSAILLMFTSCKAQEKNPEYLGIKYGVFDLDKITFLENVDMLFSKVEKYYKRPVDDGYFDEKLKKFMTTDTLYYTYRVSPKLVTQGMFKFKDFNIKSNEAIDFYMDKARNFRRIEVSVYMNAQQYKELRSATKDFKDITPENVKRVNNHKYIILQQIDSQMKIQTTLYCLDSREENNNDPNKSYFIRIAKSNLKITNDKFYKKVNDEVFKRLDR